MRRFLPIALLALAGCTASAEATRLDDRTYLIEGPGVPGGAIGPNRREADRRCPKGFYVVNQEEHRGGPNSYTSESNGVYTNWTIRCI